MNSQSQIDPSTQISHVLSTLFSQKAKWIIPMLIGAFLALFYAFALRTETYSAKQSLIVRDDLLGQSYKPGQFDSLDSQKSAQETIFEIARKPLVIRNALQQIGPPSKGFLGLGGKGYPSEEVIEIMQGNISLSAPNGAEFGQTEVIILSTKSSSRERVKEFTEVLVGEIISKVNEVRQRKFQSMESEVLQTCEVAEAALEESKNKLKEMDLELGEDAGAMVASGESSFRDDPLAREIAQLNLERRAVQSQVATAQGMLQSLKAAQRDPEAIVNISSDLTSRQPALDALKREMVEQKGQFALLAGRYTDAHPRVVSARNGLAVMERQIRFELDNAESDTREQLGIKTTKLQRLDSDIAALKSRMATLGEHRADSLTLFADIKQRTVILNNAKLNLAEIQGLASSENANLLTAVDEVQVSTRPDGLGKKALVMCGGLGGLMLGLGWVMMTAPPVPLVGRELGAAALTRPQPPVSQTPTAPTPVVEQKPSGVTSPRPPAPNPPAPNPPASQPAVSKTPTAPAPVVEQKSNVATSNQTQAQTPPPVSSTPTSSALATAGSAPAKLGAAASAGSVLRDLMSPWKRKSAELTENISLEELEKQKHIDARLKSVKATKPEDPASTEIKDETADVKDPTSTPEPETTDQKAPTDNPFLRKEIETAKAGAPVGAKIVPGGAKVVPATGTATGTASNAAVSNPASSVDPANLVKSAVASSAVAGVGAAIVGAASKVEIPEVKQALPEAAAPFNKLVDKVFEDELENKARVEAQTIQLDPQQSPLAKMTDGSSLPDGFGDTEETSAPGKGAQIKPRSANIRPVDLARNAEKDEFDRIGNKTAEALGSSPVVTPKPLEKSTEVPNFSGNPFLKDRASSSSASTTSSVASKLKEDAAVVPVPDQIRKLSDSIASFARPVKGKGGKGGPGKEKF